MARAILKRSKLLVMDEVSTFLQSSKHPIDRVLCRQLQGCSIVLINSGGVLTNRFKCGLRDRRVDKQYYTPVRDHISILQTLPIHQDLFQTENSQIALFSPLPIAFVQSLTIQEYVVN